MSLKKYNFGLFVARMQPLHFGHTQIISRMIGECNHSIVIVGSAQESRTYGNPFTYEERKRMILSFPGFEKLRIFPLKDIFNINAWARYVLNTVEKKIKNKINIYYCGNDQDGGLFLKEGIKVAITDRDTGVYKGISGSKIRATILTESDDWKAWVPAINIKLIEKVYKGEKPCL